MAVQIFRDAIDDVARRFFHRAKTLDHFLLLRRELLHHFGRLGNFEVGQNERDRLRLLIFDQAP